MIFDKVFKKALKEYYLETSYTLNNWYQLAEKAYNAACNSFARGHTTYYAYYKTLHSLCLRKIDLQMKGGIR